MKKLYRNYFIVFCVVLLSTLSTKVNAQHFNFEGCGSGLTWVIYLQGITLDGIDLEAGDEMAIFDGDEIVGVLYLTQVCSPDNVFENALVACGPGSLPPPTIGYTPGNPVFYKCWDASECIEGTEFIAEYFDPYGGAWTENIFPEGDGQYSMAEINFSSGSNEQQIELSEGYSFISSRIIAENPDMLIVMADVLNDNLDFVRNSLGNMLRKIGPNWVNGIGDWIIEEGYLIKLFADDSFIMEGVAIDPETPIQLETGFQFVSYFPDTPMDALIAYETILGNDLDFIRNSQGQILRKIGPNWVNGLGDCQPGEGYLVKMNADDILIYPGSYFTCGDPFTDPRNEQIYTTVLIGDQCWMAENLNIGTMISGNMSNNGVIEKYCYENNTANCDEYGGLYQWNEIMQYTTTQGAQGICPSGWHLPTDDEWKILEGTVDSQYHVGDPIWSQSGYRGYDAGFNLKSVSGWYEGGNGSGLYGYDALPSGYRNYYGSFNYLSYIGNFWSSSEFTGSYAWFRRLFYDTDEVYRNEDDKNYGLSVRCLRD